MALLDKTYLSRKEQINKWIYPNSHANNSQKTKKQNERTYDKENKKEKENEKKKSILQFGIYILCLGKPKILTIN